MKILIIFHISLSEQPGLLVALESGRWYFFSNASNLCNYFCEFYEIMNFKISGIRRGIIPNNTCELLRFAGK